MQNPFKEFLYFSRGERRGILVLITGIILVFLSGIFIYTKERTAPFPMKQSGGRPLPWQNTNRSSHPYKKRNKNGTTDLNLPPKNNRQPSPWPVSIPIPPTPSFLPTGTAGWMARNILRYRSKGGKFHKAEDFRNIWNDRKTISDTLTLYPHHSERHRNKNRPVVQLSCKQ